MIKKGGFGFCGRFVGDFRGGEGWGINHGGIFDGNADTLAGRMYQLSSWEEFVVDGSKVCLERGIETCGFLCLQTRNPLVLLVLSKS